MRGANGCCAVVCLSVQEQLSAASEQTALLRKENNALSTTTQLLVILQRPHVSRLFPLARTSSAAVRTQGRSRLLRRGPPCRLLQEERLELTEVRLRSQQEDFEAHLEKLRATHEEAEVLRLIRSPVLCPPCSSRPPVHGLITPTPRVLCYPQRGPNLNANGVTCSNGGRRRRLGWKRR
jgi:hypothetical protein